MEEKSGEKQIPGQRELAPPVCPFWVSPRWVSRSLRGPKAQIPLGRSRQVCSSRQDRTHQGVVHQGLTRGRCEYPDAPGQGTGAGMAGRKTEEKPKSAQANSRFTWRQDQKSVEFRKPKSQPVVGE